MVHIRQREFFLSILLCLGITPGVRAEPRSCRFTAGWIFAPPMFFSPEKGGLDFELARLIFSKLDCQITFENIPWARQIEMVKKKQNVVVFPTVKTAEREAFGLFSQAYRRVDRYIWVHKDSPILASDLDQFNTLLPGIRFGMVRGYVFKDNFDKILKTKSKELILVNNEKQTVDMLASHRIDAMATSDYEMYYNLNPDARDSVRKLGFPFDQSSRHFFLPQSKDGEQLQRLIDQAISRVMNSDGYQRILSKYGYRNPGQ